LAEAGEDEADEGEVPVGVVEDPVEDPTDVPMFEEAGVLVEPVDDDMGEEVVTGRPRRLASARGMSGPFWPQPTTPATRHAVQATLVIRAAPFIPVMLNLEAERNAILLAQPASTAKLFD
jgi:hypothetical protein